MLSLPTHNASGWGTSAEEIQVFLALSTGRNGPALFRVYCIEPSKARRKGGEHMPAGIIGVLVFLILLIILLRLLGLF